MPEVGTPQPNAKADRSHVSTSEWQSFESRMRRRRAERCILRAEEALAAGDESAAAAALAEARELSPLETPDIDTLRTRRLVPDTVPDAVVLVADTPDQGRSWLRTATAAVVILGLIIAGFALSTRLERDPELVPASASVEPIPAPRSADATAPAAPSTPPVVPADRGQPLDEAVPAPAPLRPADARTAGVGPMRVAYTAPLPTVGTAGNDTLPSIVGSTPSVAVAPPEPPAAAPPEIPAVPLAGTSAPAGPPAETALPAPPAPEPVEPRIRAVLSSYEAGFGSLDATAVHRVWPGVDERSLARAFDGLASQSVALGDCAISVRGDTATAQCQGSTTWAPKVGGGSKTEARRWEFALRSAGASWVIVRADVR